MSNGVVRELNEDDVAALTRIHAVSFANTVSTMLGPEGLARYLRWHISGPDKIASFGIETQGSLVAFCVLARRNDRLGFAGANLGYILGQSFRQPKLVSHIARALPSLLRSGPPRFRRDGSENGCKLLLAAVLPQFRGRGYGGLLVQTAIEGAQSRGFRKMCLTVDPDNAVAIRIYLANGWQTADDSPKWTGVMVKHL